MRMKPRSCESLKNPGEIWRRFTMQSGKPELDEALRALIKYYVEKKDYASATSLLDGYTCNHPA